MSARRRGGARGRHRAGDLFPDRQYPAAGDIVRPASAHRCARAARLVGIRHAPCRRWTSRRQSGKARDQLPDTLPGPRPRSMQRPGAGQKPTEKDMRRLHRRGAETTSLNQLLVRQGFARNFGPAARGRFREDEAAAKNDRRWNCGRGDFPPGGIGRHGKKDGILLGASVQSRQGWRNPRGVVPERPRNAIRLQHQGQIRGARAGHAAISAGRCHSSWRSGCLPLSRPAIATERPHTHGSVPRNESAGAAGFRRAYNCRPSASEKMAGRATAALSASRFPLGIGIAPLGAGPESI